MNKTFYDSIELFKIDAIYGQKSSNFHLNDFLLIKWLHGDHSDLKEEGAANLIDKGRLTVGFS